MSDNFVQKTANTGTTTAAVTLAGVIAGNDIVVFAFDGSTASPTTLSVADGQGSYTARGTQISDTTDLVAGRIFTLENANAGSHVITVTVTTGDSCFLMAVEVGSSSGVSAFSGANQASQTNPGTVADTLSSGSVTVTAAATLLGFSTDSSSVTPSDEPATGSGFTTRDNNTSTAIGAYRLESIAASANAAATATAVTGTHNFLTFGVAILNGGVTDTLMAQTIF